MRGGRSSGGRGSRSKRSRNGPDVDAREERRRARSATAEQASSNPPPNESEPVAAPHDGLMCVCCNEAIANTDDHVIITPCEHQLCTLCALKSHTSRGRNEHCCPVESCNNPITSGCRYMSCRDEKETLVNTTHNEEYVRANFPIELLEQNHAQNLIDDPEGQAYVLFAAVATNNNAQLQLDSIVSTYFLSKDDDINDMDESVKLTGEFGAFLHPLIVKPSMPTSRHRPVLSPRELMEYRIANMRLIDTFLYGLATGDPTVDADLILKAGHQDHQSKFLAAAVVSPDVIMRGSVDYPLEFQLMIKEVMHRQKLTSECHSLLSALHLGPSKSYELKKRHDAVVKKMKQGVKLGPRDLVIILFDNIGYKVLGRQASYDQWIVVNIVVITEAELKKLGFYVHDNDASKQISRQPSVDWEEKIKACGEDGAKKEELAKAVVGITDDDMDKLAECIMNDIQIAVDYKDDLMNNDYGLGEMMPRLDLIINSVTRKAMEERKKNQGRGEDNGKDVLPTYADVMPRDSAPTNVENEIGGNVLGHNIRDVGDSDSEDDSDDGDDEESNQDKKAPRNRYNTNNATLQMVQDDLNKTLSVEKLLQYGADSREQQLKGWEDVKGQYPATAELPVAKIINALGTDGQPAAQASKILREDNGRIFPTETFVSFGGLHTVMKTLNANGEFFEALLRETISAIRDSVPKQDYFLFPKDPRQRLWEDPLETLAHNLVAAHEYAQWKGSAGSAKEVLDFMIERGTDYSTCAFALLQLRMAAIAKMMRNSERVGKEKGVQLFFTTLKFALRLFTLTHKTDYVRLGCDLLLWYHCASPAQRKIYDHYIFTQATVNGKSVFHDYFVELSVMDLRKYTGKVYYQGLGSELEYLAATLPEKNCEGNDAQLLRDKDATSRKSDRYGYRLTGHLGKLVEKITEMKLWTPGETPVMRGEKAKEEVLCDQDIITLPGGVNLPAMALFSIMGEGDKRLIEYFIKYYIDDRDAVGRSEKQLGKVKTTMKDLKAAMELETKLATTLSAQDLKPRECKKELLFKEIDRMMEREEARTEKNSKVKIPPHKMDKSTKKDTIVEFLIQWRQKEFKKYPNLAQELKDGISKRQNKSNHVTATERKKFFSLGKHLRANTDKYS